ncbi:carnosine N-methyltransferase [Malassezia yamatoensis]|uniref:carnosine N-methyltransferase n=1 Tax=Malassezia yamatoensis TaxID=253288 RepID=A0AAJ5Z0Q7_9BASI|nr:carnosine N-methyltransferase [Malassezia yamatoensis]
MGSLSTVCGMLLELTQLSLNQTRRKAILNLPLAHQAMLNDLHTYLPAPTLPDKVPDTKGNLRQRLNEIDDRIRRNADMLSSMADFCRDFLGLKANDDPTVTHDGLDVSDTDSGHKTVSEGNQDRIRTALRQMVRDWSAEGQQERDAAYNVILQTICQRVSPQQSVRVLVPGAGLGRLPFELAMRGFSAQGNEFSFFMLIPSHFLLNATQEVNQHRIYPYIHGASNWKSAADMLQEIAIPDILPSTLPPNADLSMVAGEFIEVYSKPSEYHAWDVVATCYFLDTAKNPIRYMEVINRVLPIGGIWVNLGPLLWHFEHDQDTPSLELTLDELTPLLERNGFEIEQLRILDPQPYTGSNDSLLIHRYIPVFWVCRKVRDQDMAPAI